MEKGEMKEEEKEEILGKIALARGHILNIITDTTLLLFYMQIVKTPSIIAALELLDAQLDKLSAMQKKLTEK